MPTDYGPKAAAIVDEIISLAEDLLGPQDRDPMRTLLRIAFEVQEFLSGSPTDAEGREWTHETVCAGCESIMLARSAWRGLGQLDGLLKPGPGEDTFPANLGELRTMLDGSLRTIQNQSAPLPVRLRALNWAARLQLLFLGSTLW